MYVIVTVNTLLIKDGASICYCAYVLGILICDYVGKGDLNKDYFTAFQNNICLIISEKCVLSSKIISF